MARRSRAREAAFQVLYQDDMNTKLNPADADLHLQRRLHSPDLLQFARELVSGVRKNRGEIDLRIEQTADNWSLTRMASTDRNVLRLGAYEILYSETPVRAAINEAVELAKRFGSAQSAHFVNGILDRLMHTSGKAEEQPGVEEDEGEDEGEDEVKIAH